MKPLVAFALGVILFTNNGKAQLRESSKGVTTPVVPQAQRGWVQQNSGTTQQLADLSYPCRDTAFVFAGGGVGALRSLDGGATWQPFTTPEVGFFKFLDSRNGYVASYSGHVCYRTTDGGQHWTSADDQDQLVTLVCPVTLDTCFLSGSNSISRTTNGGKTWSDKDLNATGFNAIAFADSKHGIVVGTVQPGPLPQHPEQTAGCFTTTDGGETWVQQFTGVSQELTGVGYFDRATLIAVGVNSEVFRSSDSGKTWNKASIPTSIGLRDMSAVSIHKRLALVVGAAGTILSSTDSGVTWYLQKSGTVTDLGSVVMLDDTLALASGDAGLILKTVNGGADWVQIAPRSDANLRTQSFPDPSPGPIQIVYTLPQSQHVTLQIFDVAGRLVSPLLLSASQTAGIHKVMFDGASLPAGVYSYRMTTEQYSATGKINLIK